jgi:predicted nucleic acid-binding Zn ribbon protein
MTYLYETIPANPGEEVRRYEIKQSIHDEALTHHPETGEAIRRVILGGWGLPSLKSGGSSSSGCGCGPEGCC